MTNRAWTEDKNPSPHIVQYNFRIAGQTLAPLNILLHSRGVNKIVKIKAWVTEKVYLQKRRQTCLNHYLSLYLHCFYTILFQRNLVFVQGQQGKLNISSFHFMNTFLK